MALNFSVLPGKRRTISPTIVLFGLLCAAVFPLVLRQTNQTSLLIFSIYFVWLTLAQSWNLMGGYAGLLNLGLVSFFALGATVSGASMHAGLSLAPSILLGGLAGALFAVALIPTFRLRSDYFAIATLVIPVLMKPLVEFFIGTDFLVPSADITSAIDQYYIGLAITGFSIFGIYLLMRSKVGYALKAIGEDELASSSLGVNILLFKSIALVVGGFVASIAGSYFLEYIGSINSTIFLNLTYSLFPIFMVIIGGIGTFEGPILGALIFSVVNYSTENYFSGSTYDVLLFSVVIMIVAVLIPRGIAPSARALTKRITSRHSTKAVISQTA